MIPVLAPLSGVLGSALSVREGGMAVFMGCWILDMLLVLILRDLAFLTLFGLALGLALGLG
jgi:hypothetical protein